MHEPILTNRFEHALHYAFQLHRAQTRKGTPVPYMAHLLSVAGLVLEDGGDEDEAIAGLLHDAVEDCGGLQTLAEIQSIFGDRVAGIVNDCTDSYSIQKAPWRERKEAYLLKLEHATESSLRISLADKLHNARSLLTDLFRSGEKTWDRFNGGKDGTIWYYQQLLHVFERKKKSWLTDEFGRVLDQIELLVDDRNSI